MTSPTIPRRAVRKAVREGFRVLRAAQPGVAGATRWVRHSAFRARVGYLARLRNAEVRLELHPEARLGAVQVDIWPWTTTVVRIGAGARVGDGTLLSLRGGSLEVGERADVRRGGTYHVTGRLVIGDDTVLSTGVCVHCAESVTIGALTIIAEHTTIVDSWHRRTPPGVPIYHATSTAATSIGRNVWIGAGATVGPGVSVGDQAIVGAGAVVTRDVDESWLAVGVPARAVRRLVPET